MDYKKRAREAIALLPESGEMTRAQRRRAIKALAKRIREEEAIATPTPTEEQTVFGNRHLMTGGTYEVFLVNDTEGVTHTVMQTPDGELVKL